MTRLIRGLTLWRPWSWAIAEGHKRIENRPWAPPDWMVGQWLAIHAGKKYDHEGKKFIAQMLDTFVLPSGVHAEGIVAVARLSDVVTKSDDPWFFGPYGWVLTDIHKLTSPLKRRGFQKLWRLQEDELDAIRARAPEWSALAGDVRCS